MPMYRKNSQPPRSLPIAFKEVPAVKKPGKRASAEEIKLYKKRLRKSIFPPLLSKHLKK